VNKGDEKRTVNTNRSGTAVPSGGMRAWLGAFIPAPLAVDAREQSRTVLGAFLGMAMTAATGVLLADSLGASGGSGALALLGPSAWIVAPLGASCVLVFAAPGSPLAQPWPVIGGNTVSALIGVACATLIPNPVVAGALAVALAQQQPARVATLTLISSAGLGPEIDGDYIASFAAANSRAALKPQLAKLFGNAELVTRRLIDDVLKYKRLEGVEAALTLLAGHGFRVLRSSYWNTLLFPLMLLHRLVGRDDAESDVRDYPRWLDALFSAALAAERAAIAIGIGLPFGGSLIVVAARDG